MIHAQDREGCPIVLDGEYPAEVLENNVYAELFRDQANFRIYTPEYNPARRPDAQLHG